MWRGWRQASLFRLVTPDAQFFVRCKQAFSGDEGWERKDLRGPTLVAPHCSEAHPFLGSGTH